MADTFLPENIALIIGGISIEGFADGTDVVMIERDEDVWTKKVGVDGLIGRSKKGNQTGTCTIKLMANSPSNPLLSAMDAADQATGGGVVPFLLKSGSEVVASEHCWIQKPPSVGLGDEFPTREWVIAIGQINAYLGGY